MQSSIHLKAEEKNDITNDNQLTSFLLWKVGVRGGGHFSDSRSSVTYAIRIELNKV